MNEGPLIKILKVLYIIPSAAGTVILSVFVALHYDAISVATRGFFLSAFFLLCLDGVTYQTLPNKLSRLLALLVPVYAFTFWNVFRSDDPFRGLIQNSVLVVLSIAVAWVITSLIVAVQVRHQKGYAWGSLFLPLFCFLFFFPMFAVAKEYLLPLWPTMGLRDQLVNIGICVLMIGQILREMIRAGTFKQWA